VQGKETDKLIMSDYPVLRNGYILEDSLDDPDLTPGFQKISPFVGAVLEGKYSTKLGVGVTLPDAEESWFWGLNMPHNLIQSWRAMKLLEESEVVYSSLLSKAY
jgi:hypothetical protein